MEDNKSENQVDILDNVREMNDSLDQMVRARTKQLEESNQELVQTLKQLQETKKQLVESEKMAALGSLVAGIAHEINTPLGVSVTAASYLKDHAEKFNVKIKNNKVKQNELETYLNKSIEAASIILKNLQRAAELIHGFKQIAVDQTSDQNRQFDVEEYIKEIIFSLGPKLRNSKVKVTVDCPSGIIVLSSPGAFSHIFTNLITNTLLHAFTSDSVGQINIYVELIESNKLKIVFKDNGIGIEPDNLKSIFDPFFTTKRGAGGSGLGLHILYNTVTQSLNGQVTCESTLGVGTAFTIIVPVEIE